MIAETHSSQLLANTGVVITRPTHQSQNLCKRIENSGGVAIRFPVLEILDPVDSGPLLDLIDQLNSFDLAIFISPNAVHKVLNLLKPRQKWPETVQIAAIGAKSAQALEQLGLKVDIHPGRRFDSEALLESDQLQNMNNQRVIIFRGDGGRELLGDTLKARGAEVTYANAYRREKPSTDNGALLYHWSRGEVDVILVTSVEGLHNLFDMVGKLGQMWLRKTPIISGSTRIANATLELGHKLQPIIATDPSDEAMFDALCHWARNREVP